jgi:hypothetical protein
MIALVLLLATRPVLSGPEQTSGTTHFLIHYTESGADSIDATDTDPQNGTPDLIDDFAQGLEAMWAHATGAGWTAPPNDDGSGGDGRLDVYVRVIATRGYSHAEAAPGGTSTWIELAPGDRALGRVAARSVAAHEVHHAFQFALTTALDAWIYEATATYEQYALYDQPDLLLARDALWNERLVGAARSWDETDGLFEYSGMTWIKFIVDGGGEPMLASAWQKMAQQSDVRMGLDGALTAHFPGGLVEAFGHYVAWNEFACGRDDGMHWAPTVSCDSESHVPEQVTMTYPVAVQQSMPVGVFAARYHVLQPSCAKDHAEVSFGFDAGSSWQVTRVLEYAGHTAESVEQVSGTGHGTIVPFSGLSRGIVIVQNVGTQPAMYNWDVDVSGTYMPPQDPGVVQAIYVDPAPKTMTLGQTQKLAVRARWNTCEDKNSTLNDLTGEAQLDSSVPQVAVWDPDGTVRTVGVGTSGFSATVRGKTVTFTLVVNAAPPDQGCSAAPGMPGGWIIFLLGTVPAAAFRPSRAAGRSRPRASCRASARGTRDGTSA